MSPAHRRGGRPTACSVRPTARRARRLALVCGVLASGCAPKPLYSWGDYEGSLQASYVAHDQAKALADLETTIASAQQTGGRIPPGVCAEYGFLLYSSGQRERAIEYFEREEQLFPESKPLMDKLTAKVRQQDASSPRPEADGGSAQ